LRHGVRLRSRSLGLLVPEANEHHGNGGVTVKYQPAVASLASVLTMLEAFGKAASAVAAILTALWWLRIWLQHWKKPAKFRKDSH
jgi:hypothetical protein